MKEEKISLKEFNSLSKLEKYTLQQRAEQLTGRPVSLKDVPRILSKEKERSSIYLESEKLLKIKPGKKVSELQLIPRGKRIERYIGTTEQELISSGEKFDILKLTSTTKSVTKPLARATGKTQELETTIVKLKPSTKTGGDIKFIEPADIKKTPLSKTFLETKQITTQPKSSLVELPKIETPRPVKTITEQPKTIKDSIFAGLGRYELTSPMFQTVSASKSGETIKVYDIPPTILSPQLNLQTQEIQPKIVDSIISMDTKQIQQTKQKVIQQTIQEPKQKSITTQVVKTIQETVQQPIQKPIQKIIQKPITIQKPIQKPITSQLSRQRLRLKQEPKININPIILPKSDGIAKRILKKAEGGDLFKIFARKEGKDIEIGKASTQQEAFNILKKKLTGTLRASGFVEKEGKKVSPLSLNGDFRISKVDPFRIVEKKERRLRKTTTGKEIQYFRGSGKSKKKSNLFGL